MYFDHAATITPRIEQESIDKCCSAERLQLELNNSFLWICILVLALFNFNINFQGQSKS